MRPFRALHSALFVLFWAAATTRPALPQNAPDPRPPQAVDSRVRLGQVIQQVGRAETGRGPLSLHDAVYLGDVITVGGAGSWIEMKLDRDGVIRLGSNTRLTLGPKEESGSCARPRVVVSTLNLSVGHVRVTHDESDPETGPGMVEVRTPNAILCLLGSTVDVKARRRTVAHEMSTSVYVSAGRVEVSCPASVPKAWRTVQLTAGTMISFDDHGPAQPIVFSLDVPLSFFAISQDALGIFENSPLEDRIDPRGIFPSR